jgi:hypothetical protein
MSGIEVAATRWRHSPETWAKREFFVEEFERACSDRGVSVSWLDDEKWTGTIKAGNGATQPIYGYDLGLNSSSAGKVADSKTDTYQLLRMHNVPAVRHERISPNLIDGRQLGISALTAMAIEMVGLPLVTKPDALASGGKGVELCHEESEVSRALELLTSDGGVAAVSPYMDFDEYRAIMLDNRVRAVIEKTKQPGGWMHNHSKGAEHRLLSPDDPIYHEIGAIDIARNRTTAEVLEVNDAVSIVYPDDPELQKVAHEVYGDAVSLRLGV